MNKCKDCKWWDFTSDSKYRFCDHPKITGAYNGDELDWVSNVDEGILTGPEFGCVHWEEKES